ncbi:MAG: FHA domain-containing protein [Chloroflexi bacterium]|nr:FHA domain-containing protein [Chloroflexota bacterium]
MSEDTKLPENDGETASMSATYDLRKEAEEAMRIYLSRGSDTKTNAPSHVDERTALRFQIEGSMNPLLLALSPKMVIGRKDPISGETPDVDLTPYAAYQMGVSRTHAFILYEANQLHLHDLGSRNGTYLNGQRVTPEHPQLLHDGDELRLGKIIMRLSFQRDQNN